MAEKGSRQGQAGGGEPDVTGVADRQTHCTPGAAKLQPAHGAVVGTVWYKQVAASKHQLRQPPAWCVDCDDLDAAQAAGATLLLVEDVESGRQFLASLDVIKRHGFRFDRGCGSQLALPLKRWYTFAPDMRPAVQARLFGEAAI